MIGETPPSSLVIGFLSTGVAAFLLAARAAPVPQTIASCVAALPVMCTWPMPSCWVRYEPSAAPPCTIRSIPASMSGRSAAW